jgi:thiamine biosynthesis lipoprotein ApbE
VADFGSLAVWTADATAADCLSTGLYVLGPERALDWAAAHPGVEVIVLEITGASVRVRASPGWRGRLEPLVPGLEPEFPVPEPH